MEKELLAGSGTRVPVDETEDDDDEASPSSFGVDSMVKSSVSEGGEQGHIGGAIAWPERAPAWATRSRMQRPRRCLAGACTPPPLYVANDALLVLLFLFPVLSPCLPLFSARPK